MATLRSIISTCLLGLALAASAVPIQVLATGDMHGWLEPQPAGERWLGGAAEMLACWKRVEGYKPERFLVLSCGDTATGPVLSTVFRNDPVIEVMNLMGYDASVVGNHEFDYGLEALARWRKAATFPFLAANLTQADGTPTDLAPFVINDEQGVKVAVIGLTVAELNAIANTGGLQAQAYLATLRKTVPEARKQGAQVIIVNAHTPLAELVALAKQTADLNIALFLGGHSHEFGQIKVGNAWVVNSGEWWKGYSRITLDYHAKTGTATVLRAAQVWLLQDTAPADPRIKAKIAAWNAKLNAEFTVPLGYLAAGLTRPHGVYNFITDCWLAQTPGADIAISNDGGFRQNIPAGAVTKGVIYGVMPFTNSLVRVKLTGAQLLAYLPKDEYLGMAGLRRTGGQYRLAKTGQPIDPAATYQVLMNSYMYGVSAALAAADPAPVTIAADWRQPVFDWLLAHPTGREKPLDALVDTTPRVQ